MAQDPHYLEAWGMVTEFERRYTVNGHPGAVRLLAFLNSAHMGSYQDAVNSPIRPADIEATRAYRYKYGFGLNVEQEIIKNVGAFARLGWSDGQNEAWVFADVDHTATLGLSIKGEFWGRANDTVGLAGIINGISPVHREFFAAGGTGILAGDGNLNYGLEKVMEAYYDFRDLEDPAWGAGLPVYQRPGLQPRSGAGLSSGRRYTSMELLMESL